MLAGRGKLERLPMRCAPLLALTPQQEPTSPCSNPLAIRTRRAVVGSARDAESQYVQQDAVGSTGSAGARCCAAMSSGVCHSGAGRLATGTAYILGAR